ncbi:MAG: HNH endonuclease [Chitinophagaceae bacterium]|nr:MAG: HNH endonuclease [Chitinophagaceae bacterium]
MPEGSLKDCALCGRELAEPCTKHHLIPVSEGGKGTTTVMLHKICHDKIHRVFTEKELKKKYYTIDLIQSSQSIREFVEWIRKKEPGYYDRSFRQKKR